MLNNVYPIYLYFHYIVYIMENMRVNITLISSHVHKTLFNLYHSMTKSVGDKLMSSFVFFCLFVVFFFFLFCFFVLFFSYFSQKIGFYIPCRLSPEETICMKCQSLFSEKK